MTSSPSPWWWEWWKEGNESFNSSITQLVPLASGRNLVTTVQRFQRALVEKFRRQGKGKSLCLDRERR